MSRWSIIQKQMLIKDIKSISELSRISEVPYTTIRSIKERDFTNATIDNAFKICRAVGITLNELVNINEPDIQTTEKTQKIAVYVRTNKPKQTDDNKYYEMVKKDINNRFNQNDLNIEKIVGFDELLSSIKKRKYKAIFAKGAERFTRDSDQLVLLKKFAIENNVKLYETINFSELTSSKSALRKW